MADISSEKDFEFKQLLYRCKQQNYEKLKSECLRKGVLFKDDLFPLSSNAYYLKSTIGPMKQIEWKRPNRIMESVQPEFYRADPESFCCNKSSSSKLSLVNDRFRSFKYQLTLIKGHGNTNFVSALSILYRNDRVLAYVVPTNQTFDKDDYAGIFHFLIWQYGEWYDIVIDDRLPTVNGRLIHVHTFENLEFWPSLLEKAFAKLHGSYQSLHGCSLSEFFEDMTGGLCESINSEMADFEGLFTILCKSIDLNSYILASIEEKEADMASESCSVASFAGCGKRALPNGLLVGQSYVVLDYRTCEVNGQTIHLIKVCNPWKRINELMHMKRKNDSSQPSTGNWEGSWSKNSPEWISLPDSIKKHYSLHLETDYEFWIPLDCFKQSFTNVEICHIADNNNSKSWNQCMLSGYWCTGVSAGGSYLDGELFNTNPAYLIPIQYMPGSSASSVATLQCISPNQLVIGLMQKYRNSKRISGLYDLPIGFSLFKLNKDDWNFVQELIYDDDIDVSMRYNQIKCDQRVFTVIMKSEYYRTRQFQHQAKCSIAAREVTSRYILTEGYYLLVPHTTEPNCDGNFLLRCYSELPFRFSNKEITSLLSSILVKKHINKTYNLNRMFSRPIERIGSFDENVCVEKLQVLLSSVTTFERNCFNLDQCLSLLALYDLEYNGTLSYVQQQQLYIDIDECYQMFLRHDKAGTRSISGSELKAALEEIGIHANQRVIDMLIHRYGKSMQIVVKGVPLREIRFPSFAICLLKLRKALIFWDVKFRAQSLSMPHIESRNEFTSPSSSTITLGRNCSNSSSSSSITVGTTGSTASQNFHSSCVLEGNIFNITLLEFVQQIIYS